MFRSETVARRVAGIRETMREHGADFIAEESVWLWEPAEGYEAARRMLAEGPQIRALICMNDRLAFGAYQAAAELGRRVPEDLSIIGFDNDEVAAYLRPGLTTIALPHVEMGARAVELLLAGGPEGQHLVPMPVVERDSIASP